MAHNLKYKYGLLPPHSGALPLQLRNYLTPSLLPTIGSLPTKFGHDSLITDWGMDLNDRIGDCAIASAIHTSRLYGAEAGKTIVFNDNISPQNSAVVNYSAVTGYQPGPELYDPQDAPPNPTDRGTDIGALMQYWQNTGIVDAAGNHHQIIGAAGLTVGDWDELLIAIRLLQVVQIGIAVPDYAETQFADGQAWHVQRGFHSTVGGHCIPGVAREAVGSVDAAHIVTWGQDFVMERPFYEKFNITAAVGFSEEMLTNLKSVDGVDDQALRADLAALNTWRVA
jgi:hypothetical protein